MRLQEVFVTYLQSYETIKVRDSPREFGKPGRYGRATGAVDANATHQSMLRRLGERACARGKHAERSTTPEQEQRAREADGLGGVSQGDNMARP